MFNVGSRIKEIRIKRGLTVNGLANRAGISQSYLRDIELGNKQPTVEYLEYICDALKITLVGFFDLEENSDKLMHLIAKMNQTQKEKLIELLKEFF